MLGWTAARLWNRLRMIAASSPNRFTALPDACRKCIGIPEINFSDPRKWRRGEMPIHRLRVKTTAWGVETLRGLIERLGADVGK